MPQNRSVPVWRLNNGLGRSYPQDVHTQPVTTGVARLQHPIQKLLTPTGHYRLNSAHLFFTEYAPVTTG